MTNTITLTDEQLADLNAGKSITIDPPQQTPCQQRGLREGQWVCAETGGHTCRDGEWIQLVNDDGGQIPHFKRSTNERIFKPLNRIDWSRGIHDEKPVEKWEPKLGQWTVMPEHGFSVGCDPDEAYSPAGLEREREDHADRAAKKLRQYARLLAWRDEHCPDYVEPELGELAHYVYWSDSFASWCSAATTRPDLLSVPMSSWAAQKLAHDLNTGKVEL